MEETKATLNKQVKKVKIKLMPPKISYGSGELATITG